MPLGRLEQAREQAEKQHLYPYLNPHNSMLFRRLKRSCKDFLTQDFLTKNQRFTQRFSL
jgi:hypothetical protein